MRDQKKEEQESLGADAAAVDTAGQAVHAPQLSHADEVKIKQVMLAGLVAEVRRSAKRLES